MPDRRPKHQIEAAEDRDLPLLFEECLKFRKAEAAEEAAADAAEAAAETTHPHPQKPVSRYSYPSMNQALDNGNFRLYAVEGELIDSQIIAVLGKKGTGKTTFLRMLAETMEGKFNVSYKHQELIFPKNSTSLSLQQTVGHLLDSKIHDSCMNPKFVHNVMDPLHINPLMDKLVKDLSPGQQHSVALCLCLGKPADIYLIDEPCGALQGQCNATTKVIKWFIRHEKKAAVVVVDELVMAFDLAHGYIVIEGLPFVDCHVNAPLSVLAGLKLYSNQLDDDKPTQYLVELLLDLKVYLDSNERSEQEAAESSSYYLDEFSAGEISLTFFSLL